ncbi:hypothetical protein [Bizionia arctica]|uniref:Uncharacterized protein n=1 Tax=Bizionia arctica TaxID=1495645 RepID=A0A917LTK2_9FLAO|nr:hypothetical protein [Bizionia arctica]GGG57030.1 hypothetical protein GCM10010976_29830 [Bizionia arctica]
MQEASLLIGSITLTERLSNQEFLAEYLEPEFNYPKLFLIMEAVHAWKKASEDNTLESLHDLLNDNMELKELISAEIED